MPFLSAARVDGDAAGACKYCGERKPPLGGCSQLRPRSPRIFPRFVPFQCVAGRKISACRFSGRRASIAIARAHANTAASEEPPRPRLVAPSPSAAVENISTFCAFSMRCRQENFASPFRSRAAMPRCRGRRARRDLARSRFREFTRRRGRRRRRPKIACSRSGMRDERSPADPLAIGRRRPTVVGAGVRGSRRIEAQRHELGSSDRTWTKQHDNTDCAFRKDKYHKFRKRQLNHRPAKTDCVLPHE